MAFTAGSYSTPSAFLFDSNMILTRYKGVDVTPHTFNNLIKTITNHRSISNTSSSKNDFEEKIRDIILAFNPSLKKNSADMTTEHLLISSLKVGDKKEVTHNYNYNKWGDNARCGVEDNYNDDDDDDDDVGRYHENVMKKMRVLSREEWDGETFLDLLRAVAGERHKQYVKKIKRRYKAYVEGLKGGGRKRLVSDSDESNDKQLFGALRKQLQIKHFDWDKCGLLLRSVKEFIETNHGGCGDTVEKYLYGLRCIGLKLVELREEVKGGGERIAELQSELAQSGGADTQLTKKNGELVQKNQALQNRVELLLENCEKLDTTINYNAIELAKLAAAIGDKDHMLENLGEHNKSLLAENATLSDRINTVEQAYQAANLKWTQVDEDNTQLLMRASQLESRIKELEDELSIERENSRVQQQTCNELLYKNDRDNTDRDRDSKMLINRCAEYENRIEQLCNEKHLLSAQLEEARVSTEEIVKRLTVDVEQSRQQCVSLRSSLMQKQQEFELCEARVMDAHNNYKVEQTELNRRIRELEVTNQKLREDNEKNYEEATAVIEEKVALQTTIKQLNGTLDRQRKELKEKSDEYEEQIKQLKEEHEQQVNDVTNSLTQVFNNKFRDRSERDKSVMVDKFKSDKDKLVKEYEAKIKELENSLVVDGASVDNNDLLVEAIKRVEDSRKRKKPVGGSCSGVEEVSVEEKKRKGGILPIKNISFVKPNVRK